MKTLKLIKSENTEKNPCKDCHFDAIINDVKTCYLDFPRVSESCDQYEKGFYTWVIDKKW